MAKHIIFIHGRSSKPWIDTATPDFKDPRQIEAAREGLRKLYLKAFLVGLKRHASRETFEYWNEHRNQRIHMAYYGHILNQIAEESDGLLSEVEGPLQDLINRTADVTRGSVNGFIRDQASELVAFIAEGFRFKDRLLLSQLKDLRKYVRDHDTSSAIRRRLHNILDPLLADGQKVAIIGHSLGTLVAYDALWKISRRSEFVQMRDRKLELMVTAGSPLGNEAFLNKFRIDAALSKASQFPRNIRRWRNFSAQGDFVTHDARLRGDFWRRRFLQYLENRDLVDHVGLYNPYHSRKGRWNPHKMFGYLLQPTLAKAIDEL